MSFSTIFTLILIAIVIAVIASISGTKKTLKARTANLKAISDFGSDEFYFGDKTGIALDKSNYNLNLFEINSDNSITSRIVSYRDILSVEVFEDGDSTTKTSRTSQASSALIGGALLGGVGLLVGGLSGKKVTTENVNRVDLRIVVNDVNGPIHDVNFLMLSTKRGGVLHKSRSDEARKWSGILEVLIQKADDEDKLSTINLNTPKSNSIADELAKLSSLLESGILNNEEFQAQKSKLLNS